MMKQHIKISRGNLTVIKSLFAIWLILLTINTLHSQADQRPPRPVTDMFESIWVIDNQTVIVPYKGTFEWDIQHRFGIMDNGYEDFFGLAAPSNIRMGFNYVPIENLQIGFGVTKEQKLYDFNLKYAIFQQKQGTGLPISLSYFLSMGFNPKANIFDEFTDRFSYFNQIMVASKFSDNVSVQVAPSMSYFNAAIPILNNQDIIIGHMDNIHWSVSFLGRIKIGESSSLLFNYDLPLTNHDFNDPNSNVGLGLEFATSAHAFQIFFGNFSSISPQYNNLLNQNQFKIEDTNWRFGFNMTRLWSF